MRHRMGQRKLEKQTRVCFNFGILNLHFSAILAARNLDVEGRYTLWNPDGTMRTFSDDSHVIPFSCSCSDSESAARSSVQ